MLPHCFALAESADPSPAEGPAVAGATLRDDDPGETYAGVRYIWLGRYEIELEISGQLPPRSTMVLTAGSKNDRRAFVAEWSSQGKPLHSQTIEYGSFDGFQKITVKIPQAPPPLVVRLKAAGDRAAFFSHVAVVGPADHASAEQGTTVLQVRLYAVAPSVPAGPVDGGFVAAFPEVAQLWPTRDELPESYVPVDDESAFRLAALFGRQAHEMFFRSKKYMEGWLAHADPTTGLIPRNLTNSRDVWNAEDAAADNYPFLVLTAFLTDRALFEGRMLEMLRTETRLTSRLGALPDAWSFSKQGFVREEVSLPALIFGGSEYVKDGLLPLTEFLGPSPWLDRLIAIEDAIWEQATIETPYGPIPSTNVEVNGEQLQVLSRLFWLTGDRKYLEWAQRLGDYYLLGGHHPTHDFDELRLRDHGCEIVSGLCELYVAVSFASKEKADQYRGPIHQMCDDILRLGRDSRGMLYNVIYPKKGTHDPGICDTWGYNYNGIYSVYMVDKKPEYREAIRFVLGNLLEQVGDYHWGVADEYADSLEGAITLYNREPVPSAARWIDHKIRDMWKPQGPGGIIEGWHGDGNIARTAFMYAFWKSQGLRVEPWREDIRLGAVNHGGQLYVSITVSQPYQGRLIFDRPRHRHFFHLPIDYPRINQFPEWFTVDQEDSLIMMRDDKVLAYRIDGPAAWEGVPLNLTGPGEHRFVVRKN